MRAIKILALVSLILFLIISSAGFFYYRSVWLSALQTIKRENIQKIIFAESPVYYEDGKNVIGVFFHEQHRRYLEFKDIPKTFIDALIAAEDGNFYEHYGFDLRAILRALFVNIISGRVVQGGSTLTQQTAKNILEREKRSFRSKIKELIHALILEEYYTKDEILEFYSNQFFVNSNGRGVAVAAEYFFDKPVSELNLVESAFIAGAVKGPNRYNPFTKKTLAAKERAELLAKQRKDYVLRNMYNLGMLSKEEYETARGEPVLFKEGKISYRLNVILDYIREQLQSEPFRNILLEQGIDNIATSGIKIYTTIDKDIQEGAFSILRKNLSYVETKLNGYNRKLLQARYARLTGEELDGPKTGEFCLGRVSKVVRSGSSSYIDVEFQGAKGRIDYSGLLRLGNAWMKSRVGEWGQFDSKHVGQFLKRFHPGDLVYVHVKGYDSEFNLLNLELERMPVVQGGVAVVKNGEIKAMVSGFQNTFFNRTVDAKRQLGSIFKPILYTAALQLGWNNLDALANTQGTFRFENILYAPRPDHESPHSRVSLAWAGVKSENLATVWLLYHLCDRLNMDQFRQVAEKVGLSQREDESYIQYMMRIRDENGVVVNEKALREAAFEEAKKELIPDLIFEGKDSETEELELLSFERFSERDISNRLSGETIDRLSIATQKQYEGINKLKPYDMRVLSRVRDFRVLVSLKYVVKLAERMGILTKLDEVLSFPLGSNSISILEAARAYHTILSGTVYPVAENGSMEYTPVIKKIVDPQGEVIYEYNPRGVRILDKRISNMVIPILRQAVEHGTGKSAEGNILVRMEDFGGGDLPRGIAFKIPAFGKTGTSNDFTNSSFCGFIPAPTDGGNGLRIEDSYVIASYIGYDDNRPLESKHIKIYGASGALPIWIDVANTIVNTKKYRDYIDPADLVFQGVDQVPLPKPPETISVPINPYSGLPVSPDTQGGDPAGTIRMDTYGEVSKRGFVPGRFFLPFP